MSELDHENGGTRILPSSALWRRTPRRPQGHTLETLDEQIMAQQKEMDEEKFAAESIPATGEPGDMLVYIGQSWHTAGANITEDRTRCALVGQWIPMYFRGDTELHDLDTRLLESMPETTLRCLGVDHRKGNNRNPKTIGQSIKYASETIGRALSGGAAPFHPGKEPSEVPSGPPLKVASAAGVVAAGIAAAAPNAVVRGVA